EGTVQRRHPGERRDYSERGQEQQDADRAQQPGQGGRGGHVAPISIQDTPSASPNRAICSAIGRGAFGVLWPSRPSTFSQITPGPAPLSDSRAPACHLSSASKL